MTASDDPRTTRDAVEGVELAIAGLVLGGHLPIDAVLDVLELGLDDLRSPVARNVLHAVAAQRHDGMSTSRAAVWRRMCLDGRSTSEASAALRAVEAAAIAFARVNVDLLVVAAASAAGARRALKAVLEQRKEPTG